MSNPSKAVGSQNERRLATKLQTVWPSAKRLQGNTKSNDFQGTPLTIEAKCRRVWAIPAWVREIRKVAPDGLWVLFVSPRDMRTVEDKVVGRLMVVDEDFGIELLDAWARTEIKEG